MNRSTFRMIKYMNGSLFSRARYMNGVGFEILARTPVPELTPPPRRNSPSPPPPSRSYLGHVLNTHTQAAQVLVPGIYYIIRRLSLAIFM